MGTGGGLVIIDFSEQGNSAFFRRSGWSSQEPDRVWAVGPRSVLRVPIQSSNRPVVLEAEIGPNLAAPLITGQIVRVRVNGAVLGGVRLNARSMICCEIDPAHLRDDGIAEIEFEFPGFFRADWLRGAGEDRPLSGWFSFIRIYTTDMFKPGPHFPSSGPAIRVIGLAPPFPDMTVPESDVKIWTFGKSGDAAPCLREGWDEGEDDLTWSAAPVARLDLPAPATPGSHLLRFDATPMLVSGRVREQHVTVALDGIVVS